MHFKWNHRLLNGPSIGEIKELIEWEESIETRSELISKKSGCFGVSCSRRDHEFMLNINNIQNTIQNHSVNTMNMRVSRVCVWVCGLPEFGLSTIESTIQAFKKLCHVGMRPVTSSQIVGDQVNSMHFNVWISPSHLVASVWVCMYFIQSKWSADDMYGTHAWWRSSSVELKPFWWTFWKTSEANELVCMWMVRETWLFWSSQNGRQASKS